jgi:hypothetical protein
LRINCDFIVEKIPGGGKTDRKGAILSHEGEGDAQAGEMKVAGNSR